MKIEDEAMVLEGRELELFARRIITRHVSDPEWWLQWEDYPHLSEATFGDLVDQAAKLVGAAYAALTRDEVFWDIDAQELIQRAEDGPYNQAAAE